MKILKFAAIAATIVSAAHAVPTSFSNNLKGYDTQNTSSSTSFLSASGFEPTTIDTDPAINFTANGAKFGQLLASPAGQDGWPNRNFLRTTETGYGTVSFFAFVTAQRDFVPTNGPDGYGAVYFGLGSANARYFRTPDGQDGPLSNTSTYFRWQAQEYVSWHAGVKDLSDNNVPEIGFTNEPGPVRKQGTTRLFMSYDATAKTVTYAIDYNYTAPFIADQSTTFNITAVANEFINGERSSIFFGSNGEVSFSDFSVQLLPPVGPFSMSNSLTGFAGNSQSNHPAQPLTLLGSGLNASFVWAGGDGAFEKIAFTPTGTTFGSFNGGDGGRNYLRTNAINYATVPFSAYVTVARTTRESVFFGLGTGALAQFGQPDVGDGKASVFLELQGGFDNGSRRVLGGTSGTPTNNEVGFDGMTSVTGPMRLRMDYDPIAKTVVYSIDYSPSGAFVADQTFATVDISSITPEWAAGESSSIYFGGEDGMTFTDFSVVVASSATPFQQWAATPAFGLAVGQQGPAANPDNDSTNNLLEYALNGNPSISDPAILPTLAVTTPDFEFTYSRLDASLADTVQTFEYGSTLVGWTPVVIPAGPGVITVGAATVTITDTGTTDTVKISIPRSVNVGGKLFGRLNVNQ